MPRFAVRERGSSARVEALAGVTTFMAMSYIVFVQPSVLGAAGMDPGAVFVAT
jgi:AGZA family xanthine/uracil permease-like MFS transporter